MIVLQVIPELDAGGAERTTVDIARAIVAAGGTALVASAGGRLEPELAATGAEMIRLPLASKNPLTLWANAAALARIIRERNVAIVHARSRAPAWSALLAARRTGVRFVTTYHGIYNARSAFKRWYNGVMAQGDAVIANSAFTARHLVAVHGTDPARVTVIPRGTDLARFDPAAVPPERVAAMRASWGLTGGAPVILLPGRLTRWKGQAVAITALAGVPGAVLVLAGDAQGREGYVAELDALAQRLGLGGRVVRPGHVADMPAALAAADVVVSASTEPEAFGRVAVEAQAMARPVVATAIGATEETVRDGVTGHLVPPGDAEALAATLRELLARDPVALAAMGAAGRAHVLARFTVAAMASATLGVYQRLLAARPVAALDP